MKRIIFLLLVSLLSLTAMAQELTIKSFELTNSLDGKKYARLDANDDPCALIKVALAKEGATFHGNVVCYLEFDSSDVDWSLENRWLGQSVRAICVSSK